jgi:hypothetical protein
MYIAILSARAALNTGSGQAAMPPHVNGATRQNSTAWILRIEQIVTAERAA